MLTILSFQILKKCCAPSSGLSGFLMRSPLSFNLWGFFPLEIWLLSPCFPDFIFVFIFQKFEYDVSWWTFLWFYPVWDSLSFLTFYVHVFLSNLGSYQPLFIWVFLFLKTKTLLLSSPSPLLPGLQLHKYLTFLIIPQVSEALFSCFQPIFYCSCWVIFSIFKFMILSCVASTLLLSLLGFPFQFFSSFKIPIWFFIISFLLYWEFLFLCWDVLLFHLFQVFL